MKSFTKQAPEAKPTLIREFEFVAMPLGKVSTYPRIREPRIRRGSICPREADE